MNTARDFRLLLILGMHRSGTSALAGMLRSYGLELGGEIHDKNNFNLKGNQEHLPSRSINHELILLNGGTWYLPRPVTKYFEGIKEQVDEVKDSFIKSGRSFGIKDPRMLFCIDVWRDQRTDLVGTIRHPELVVRSLETRNRARAKKVSADWYKTWWLYNCRLLELYEEDQFPIVNFDWPEDKYTNTVRCFARNFGLVGEESFFETGLRHQEEILGRAPGYCLDLYKKLCDIAEKEHQQLISS